MFSIGGISTCAIETISPIIQQVWDSPNTKSYITSLINAVPEDQREGIENALCLLMDSMWVQKLDTKSSGRTMVPHYNIYMDSSGIHINKVWVCLRNYLANCTYMSCFQGKGKIKSPPFHYGVCHSTDHPRGLCPFPNTPGWNGPSKCPVGGNMDHRNSRLNGPGTYAWPNRYLT
jgi:hypothetical protein